MTTRDTGDVPRELGFTVAVRSHVAFVEATYDFRVSASEENWVRFESRDYFIEISFGRLSYEIDTVLGRRVGSPDVEKKFSLASWYETLFPEDAGATVFAAATTPEHVERFIGGIARSLERVLQVLYETPEVFERVVQSNAEGWQRHVDGMNASRLRRAAESAWRAKDLATVVLHYEEFEREVVALALLPSERARLNYARKHRPEGL